MSTHLVSADGYPPAQPALASTFQNGRLLISANELGHPRRVIHYPKSASRRPGARALAVIGAALVMHVPAVQAQHTADSLARALTSTSIHERAEAVARLNTLPEAELSRSARNSLVTLFNAEAMGRAPVDPEPVGAEDETYSEYLVDLTDVVLKLRDPASLPGLARIGIQTSYAAQRYVASFGATALPVLDAAWRTEERARPSIVTTWAFLLAQTGGQSLKAADRGRVIASIVAAVGTYPIAVAAAAEAGPLTSLSPVLADMASHATSEIVRRDAREAVNELAPLRAALSSIALLDQTSEWVTAICATGHEEPGGDGHEGAGHRSDARASTRNDDDRDGEQGRSATCERVRGSLAAARVALLANRPELAKLLLRDAAQVAGDARAKGIFSSAEAALIQGNVLDLWSRL